MLDKNALSQLKDLKKQIADSKEYAEGVVKGTQRKFGFVITADGREIYLPPEEMQKVFPGDEVKILVINPTKGSGEKQAKVSGQIEKLLNSPVKSFAGRYVVRGKGHFVEPDLPRMSRWIFVPPALRNNAKDGDFVYCKISRHPFPQAQPQAKVLVVIGKEDKTGIEAEYIIEKFQLEPAWPQDWQKQIDTIDKSVRQDLTATPFITIDASSTLDMDDALYARATDRGWELQVAIADVSALIRRDSQLDAVARQRATSVYLPGRPVPMLPEALANEQCSLLPEQERPTLVCTMQVERDGSISSVEFTEALITSRAKLNYQQVAAFIDGDQSDEACLAQADNLTALKEVSEALLNFRSQHQLVIPSRQDYRLVLNEQKKLARVEAQPKTRAHQLVEECMIATNRSAADYLGDEGLYIEHAGFRAERLPDVKKLAEEQLAMHDVAFETPEGYRQLMNAIDDAALEFPLRAVLSRLLERSRLSHTPKPHQGMGLPRYTTITSPIRKYSDLVTHRLIKTKLHQRAEPIGKLKLPEVIDTLQSRQDNARQANYQMEQWLKCQFMKGLVGQTFSGVVSQINSNGFTVRLDEHLIEGFVETRQLGEKYSFDPMRLRLKSQSGAIELDQVITVIVKEVDIKQRSIRYTLPEQPTAVSDASQADDQEKTKQEA